MGNFLSSDSLLGGGPRGLLRATERLLLHIGFSDVRIIDGANDQGADLLAAKGKEKWIVQCKWTSGKYIDQAGVDDCERAKRYYSADKAILITNASLSPSAVKRRKGLEDLGISFVVWDGPALEKIWGSKLADFPTNLPTLRDYQEEAAASLLEALRSEGRALLVLATGLGKTMIASTVIASYVASGARNILVLAHLKELVEQLERAIWPVLDKHVETQILHGHSKPKNLEGITVATPDSAILFEEYDYQPDLIIIDEAHHLSESGMYASLLKRWPGANLLGLTATPWRGDKYDIEQVFGAPNFSMGIAEGMARGWLSDVDYRIYSDNIDWDFVKSVSQHGYSIKDLNRKLFLPERDELIIERIRAAWLETSRPQAIVFCSTIEHANSFAKLLQSSEPAWLRTQAMHSEMSKRERDVILNNFRLGRIPIITCVDVFNEGVDVPDVSLICFLRVTHSRRIFVQQLGRGLRLANGKSHLKVLDFVTDIRRVAAALDLRKQLQAESENLLLGNGSKIDFSDETSGVLLDYWIEEAADLETAHDDVILNFPDPRVDGPVF